MSADWFRKQRGWYFSLLPQGTWIARKMHGQWSLFYLSMAVGSKTERHGQFPRLRAAKKYAASGSGGEPTKGAGMRSSGQPYTHEQLWALAQQWWDLGDDEVDAGAALTYRYCADQLTELLGPLASAGGVGNQPKKNHRRRKRPEGWSVSSPGKVLPEVVEGPFELPPSTSGPNQSAGAVGNQP